MIKTLSLYCKMKQASCTALNESKMGDGWWSMAKPMTPTGSKQRGLHVQLQTTHHQLP
jgi:hypothetical protein